MNTDKINRLFKLFVSADTIYSVNDNADIEHAHFVTPSGHPDKSVIYLEWDNGLSGDEFEVNITESGLDNATLSNGYLILKDSNGDTLGLRFFKKTQIVIDTF